MVISRDAEKTVIRLPEGMLEQLKEVAAANGRSRNSEIAMRLAESLKRDQKRLQREKEAA